MRHLWGPEGSQGQGLPGASSHLPLTLLLLSPCNKQRQKQGSKKLDHFIQVRAQNFYPGVPSRPGHPTTGHHTLLASVTLRPNHQRPGWPLALLEALAPLSSGTSGTQTSQPIPSAFVPQSGTVP